MYTSDQRSQRERQDSFHPVIHLPEEYHVLDLSRTAQFDTSKSTREKEHKGQYQIGKFDEVREELYNQPLFNQESSPRCVHMGIDIGAPVHTEVFSFDRGVVYAFGALKERGDYGHTVVIEYVWRDTTPLPCGENKIQQGQTYWALYGHLSAVSMTLLSERAHVNRGQLIGWLGGHEDNGGWPPHLHFQLSRSMPANHDLPGVVTLADRHQALNIYPDPRDILGAIY